ncbi:MAG: lamin tail domain-containing protein, partial [Pyrinomonadaceae bacterium]
GTRAAFAAKDNPFGTNADGNSEIFYFDGSQLRQVTNTTPGDVSLRHVNGNFQPSMTDDGRFIAFSSNRDINGLNGDGNLEIFIYDTAAQTFARLTNTAGTIGATDAKISGDGSRIAYIRDSGTLTGGTRDLILQPRTGGAPLVIADNVLNLRMTYGRAISDNGQRVVYSAPTERAPGSPQVFLYDAPGNRTRQITTLAAPEEDGDVPLHPTISGGGSRITFATRRNVNGGNSDDSVELYGYRIATGQFTRLTTAPSSANADVVSSMNDDGTLVAFNFPRVLSGPVSSSSNANNSEIYVTGTSAGVPEAELIVLNGASFGNEPSTTKAVAPESIAVALGDMLATTTLEAQGSPPFNLGGTTVTVNNRPAQIFAVSPELVTFLVPAATETGTATVVVTNSAGARKTATVAVLTAAPGVFTRSNDGRGEGFVVDAQTGQFGPFDPTNGNKRLIVRATGVRHASEVTVTIGGRLVTVESVTPSSQMLGLDEIRILLPADLRGVGVVDLIVRADDRASNPVTVTISGTPRRDIIINEVLADPPLDLAGDANHDGVRDSADDEFVELVNSTASDIDIGGFQLLTRSSTADEDTLRHVFAPGTIFPAGTAIVVFGGGSPPVGSPVFGGAQVFTASKNGAASSLSLTNSGGVVTLREPSSALVASLSYGGSTGLDADNDQSLTRSPDITGNFVPHLSAQGSNSRAFSPGTRTDGSPFAAAPAIARIQITPASANIGTGARQQFIARAFNSSGQELSGVIFRWQSSAPAVATIDENGLATGRAPGTTQIRATARGVTSQPATLTVFFQAQVLTRIEVTPATANVPPGGQQQFTARAIDQNGNEIAGVQFAWSSTNEAVATVNQSGLATALSLGTTQIRATAQNITGSATLNVVAPVLVINEVLADPPGSTATDLAGDANHDGVRSSTHDEFIELVNSSNASLNISGWTVSTRPLDETTERVRHTFAADSTLPARSAFVIFGGGDVDPNHPAFGCAQVVKASGGSVSLTNTGLTILVRDAAGNLFAQFTYGGSTDLNGGSNQSLTRSPDITGNFVLHTQAAGANGRAFSPGTKADGSPFGPCQGRLTRVTISPASSSVIINQTTQFTAQAFDQFGQPLTGVTFTFSSSNTSVATIESVTTNASTGIATATVRGRALGSTQITATATKGTTTVTSSPATLTVIPVPPRVTRLEVTPESATINRGATQQFTATAFNQNAPVSGVSVSWISSNDAVATVDQNGLARGVGIGTVTITATAPDGQGGTVSDSSTLTVQVPLVINELLGDVPLDDETTAVVEGDANRDGVRDSGDDEFIELVNNSTAPVDISGVTISDSTSKRFTFPANTTLASGRALIVFGGGSPPANDPAFGGSTIFKASSLGFNDTGDTVEVKLTVAGTEVLIAALTYGGDDPPPAPSDRSLTRSPDAERGTTGGNFIAHTSAINAAGRRFSPGTRADGTPFGSPPITRIQVTPATATINVGGTRLFTARAFSNTGGPEVEVLNVSFIWDSSDPAKATVAPVTGATTTATGIRGGGVTISARAGGQQGTASLTINFPPIVRIDVTPASARAPIGGTQQFTARAFDANNNEIVGVQFTWTSSNKAVATIDQNGLATALGLGTTTITASAQNLSDTAKLTVVARTVVINEVLADPPDDAAGDANHDGVRDSSDDEFVELANAQATAVNISGWTIRTLSLTGTSETLRHTFAPSTTLPAGDAVVVFGGGTFDPLDPVFGGAQVVKASTGRLSLTNTGLTIIVRDAAGNLVTQFMYGGSTGLSGGSNQSLTRSPDITGNFVLHTQAAGAGGRRYSPGRKADGSFFVPRTGNLTSVDISP